MAYLDDFIESMKFNMEFDGEYKENNPDFEQLKSTLTTLWDRRDIDYYKTMQDFLKRSAGDFCKDIPKKHIINKCHAISQSFYDNFEETKFAEEFRLSITIGNVYYKGKNIYNVDRDKIRELIRSGKQLDKELGVHVWLTFENMMVIDLTILPTLANRATHEK